MKMTRNLLCLVCLLAITLPSASPKAFGTAGIAEWEIYTPLGNEVNHTDPFIGEYGTSIRSASTFESDSPFIVKVQTWTFYVNYVAGYAEKGFFLFNETTKQVEYFQDEASQKNGMHEKGLLNPISRLYTNEKGWREVWTENRNPRFSSAEELLKQTEDEIARQEWFQKLPDAQKKLQKDILRQRMKEDAEFLDEEHAFYTKAKREVDTYPEFRELPELLKQKIRQYIDLRLKASTFVVE